MVCFYNPSVLLRNPPPFTQGRLTTARQYTYKCNTHYTLRARRLKRSTNKLLVLLLFLSAGKTCFMESAPCGMPSLFLYHDVNVEAREENFNFLLTQVRVLSFRSVHNSFPHTKVRFSVRHGASTKTNSNHFRLITNREWFEFVFSIHFLLKGVIANTSPQIRPPMAQVAAAPDTCAGL